MKGPALSHGRATARSLVSRAALVCAAAVLVLIAGARPAAATHNPVGPCSPGYEKVRGVDLETFFDGKSNLTICLGENLADNDDFNVRWSNMNHVTVRSAPGSLRLLRSRIWIDDTSAQLTQEGLALSAYGFVSDPGASSLAINADNVKLQRNTITNGFGLAGSCVNNDPTYGVATNLQILANRIFACGRDETHDHGVYTNSMENPVLRANWIYENAGRGINLGPGTQGATIYRNVIADNCANPLGGTNDCSANVMFWGSTSGTEMNNNTIAFPDFRWNVAGCDDATGSCGPWTGTSNNVGANCFFTTSDVYSGDPPASGISPGFPGKYATVAPASSVVADPLFTDRSWVVLANRNYHVNNSSCALNQPQQVVGTPAP